jgi:glycosyltransferase involved in cell wall biosynthesis
VKVSIIGLYPPPFGGVSVHIKRLRLALQQQGVKVSVLAQPNSESGDKRVFPTHMGPAWYINQLLTSDDILFHYHASGIHVRKSIFLSVLARFGKPVILTLHSFRNEPVPTILNHFYLIALRSFTHIICVGSDIRKQVIQLGVDPLKISIIPSYLRPVLNDHDRQQISPAVNHFLNSHWPVLTANAFRLNFFNGEDLYGLDMCVELCRNLIRDYHRMGFVFALPSIGNEEYYILIRQRISEYGLKDHFCFSLKPTEYWPIIERSALFVRPTNTDSYGVSVAEAIDLGVPAIASAVCNRPQGTILFNSRNLNSLIKEVRLVLGNLDEHKRRLINDRTDQKDTIDQIMTVYRYVLNSKGKK